MDRLGLGYETMSSLNPAIIYLSVTGHGQDSDRKDEPVHDLNLVAETGLLSLNRRDNERPVIPAIPVSDYMSGLLGALSIVASLYERKPGEKGKALDISMLDATLSSLNVLGSMVLYTGKSPEEGGFAYPKEFPNYNVYECQDGRFLAVACLERPFWQTFCRIIERPDLEPVIEDQSRQTELREILETVIRQKTLSEWTKLFDGSKCCVSPVNTINEAFESYPLKERGMVADLIHPVLGNIPQILFPVDKQLRKVRSENGDNRLTDLLSMLHKAGYSDADIDKLIDEKIISLPGEIKTSSSPTR